MIWESTTSVEITVPHTAIEVCDLYATNPTVSTETGLKWDVEPRLSCPWHRDVFMYACSTSTDVHTSVWVSDISHTHQSAQMSELSVFKKKETNPAYQCMRTLTSPTRPAPDIKPVRWCKKKKMERERRRRWFKGRCSPEDGTVKKDESETAQRGEASASVLIFFRLCCKMLAAIVGNETPIT